MDLPQQRDQDQKRGFASAQKERWSDNAPAPALFLTFKYGLNENVTPGLDECTQGVNFDLDYNRPSLIPRLVFDLKGTAPAVSATVSTSINSLMQLLKRDNTQTTLVVAGPNVYQWDGDASFVSKGAVVNLGLLRSTYWSLGDYLVISDLGLKNVMKTWDGTTFGDMTTGLGDDLFAKYAIVHGNRVWLFNIVVGTTPFPQMILACKFEDPTVWDPTTRGGPSTVGGGTFATGLEPFFLFVPDLKPINGVELYQNVLIISTLGGRMWQLTGTSAKDYTFTDFYDTASAIGDESIRAIGNDVIFVRQGGNIALLYSTQAFGNVLTADLSHWIPNTGENLSQINAVVYDVLGQRVLLFIPNKVLVLFKKVMGSRGDTGTPSPWGVYQTADVCNFNTAHAVYILRPGTTDYSVFFGDSIGRVFDLNGAGTKDAGLANIDIFRRSRHIGSEVVSPWPWTEENLTGHVRYQRRLQVSVSITFEWDDEYNDTQSDITLKGPLPGSVTPFFGGPFFFGPNFFFGPAPGSPGRVSSINIEPGGKGPGFYISVSASVTVPVQIDAIELD